MTERDQQGPPKPDPKVAPESLELRARPQPVTRINRKVVIGAAAVLLCLISVIVLLALEPPSLRVAGPQELFNVEHKPVTDALSKLPASYDGVKPEKKVEGGKPAPMAHAVARAMGFGHAPLPIARPVYMPWTYQEELVRRQRAAWRFAAAASAALCISLAAMLSMAISRPAIALHLIEVSRRTSDRMGDYATPPTPGRRPRSPDLHGPRA
jgi:hypothetical protein